MFGYIVPNHSALTEEQNVRFRALYCGLCRKLRQRYGLRGSATLSYDLTFLALLLNGLYEPEELKGLERCPTHPVKKHPFTVSDPFEYVADINVALAYHKLLDNWRDDRNFVSLSEAKLLQRSYHAVAERNPEKCRAIECWLDEIHAIEADPHAGIDAPVNSTGKLMGELFVYTDDCWAESLRTIGDGLGRFVYFMDAYDDYLEDVRRKRFNPLISLREGVPDFESVCQEAMTMMVADATAELERLPILKDIEIIRNVLYSGIWTRYAQIQKKRNAKRKGAE